MNNIDTMNLQDVMNRPMTSIGTTLNGSSSNLHNSAPLNMLGRIGGVKAVAPPQFRQPVVRVKDSNLIE